MDEDQRARYLRTETPVALITRDASTITIPKRNAGNWLGAVSWSGLRTGLEALPVQDHEAEVWRSLISVMVEDGDFELKRPTKRATSEVQLLEAIQPRVFESFQNAVKREYGVRRARAFFSTIRLSDVSDSRYYAQLSLFGIGSALVRI